MNYLMFVVLVFTGPFSSCSEEVKNLLHVFVSCCFVLGVCFVFGVFKISLNKILLLSSFLGCLLGVMKECVDYRVKSLFSFGDLFFDFVGVSIACVMFVLVSRVGK
jgi:hypothetical protein